MEYSQDLRFTECGIEPSVTSLLANMKYLQNLNIIIWIRLECNKLEVLNMGR